MISTVVSAVQVYASGVVNFVTARPPFWFVASPINIEETLLRLSSFGPFTNMLTNDFRMVFIGRLYNKGPAIRMKRMRLMALSGNAKYVSMFGMPVL